MPLLNPSFETALIQFGVERPGRPGDWDGAAGGTSWEWGTFDSVAFTAEDFEVRWSANEGRRTIFGGGQLDAASFDVTTPEAFEDFEEEWSANEGRKTSFAVGQLDDASFDVGAPEAFEDFEEEWSANEGRRTVFGGGELDDASFDAGAPEAFEDFEEEWWSNEGRRTVFGGGELDVAQFAIGVGTGPTETFSDNKTINVPPGVAIGAFAVLDVTQASRVIFGGTLSGTLELQIKRQGFSTWETIDTITAVPATTALPAGYTDVRIERKSSGGTTTAELHWPELTDL
jgi:hypothetical protein